MGVYFKRSSGIEKACFTRIKRSVLCTIEGVSRFSAWLGNIVNHLVFSTVLRVYNLHIEPLSGLKWGWGEFRTELGICLCM